MEKNILMEFEREKILHFIYNKVLLIGDFKLKSGKTSKYYFDGRIMTTNPIILNKLTYKPTIDYTSFCGVPFGAITLATHFGLRNNKQILILRKEPKNHGINQNSLVIGDHNENTKVIICEDTITTGSSILETISQLEKENIKVVGVVCLFDREEGGVFNIKKKDTILIPYLR